MTARRVAGVHQTTPTAGSFTRSAATHSVAPSAQDHGTAVTQVTNGKTLILPGGATGQYRNRVVGPRPTGGQKRFTRFVLPADHRRRSTLPVQSVTPSTQDRGTAVTQVTNGKTLLLPGGASGQYKRRAMVQASSATLPDAADRSPRVLALA